MKTILSIILSVMLTAGVSAQCETWLESPGKDDAENAHVIYRQYVNNKDYDNAFTQWKVAYDIAPAADGNRDSHFRDGIEIYKHKYKNAADEAKKEEFAAMIMELYEKGAQCISSGAIKYGACNDQSCRDVHTGQWTGRQAFDMYYLLQPPRAETYEVIRKSVDLTGNNTEYIILRPYADLLVYLYSNEKISAEEARTGHARLREIAGHNVASNKTYGESYQQAQASMEASMAKIEGHIYDCAYFVEKLKPEYEADPSNVDNLVEIIKTLKRQGCEPGEPFLDKLQTEYAAIAEEYNKEQDSLFLLKNPAVAAKRCYDNEEWDCAVERFKEAIEQEEDPEKKASYYFSIASIQYRQLNSYSSARSNARLAAELKNDWGRPYMLIGDMYAKSSRDCGDDAYSRGLAVLAALDKWAYAKSIDESVAAEANRNIARFSQYMPPQDDAFMMGKKEGESDQVGCWIGESVRLRFN